jgi:predicted ATPase/DNA-binding SARP family transcriptional activator
VNSLTETPTIAMNPPSPLRFHLLGPIQIEREGERVHLPRRKVESLLAYLLLHPERHSRDYLATLFWGDSSDAQARHSLRTALATVRQQVSAALLITERDFVQLNPDYPVWTDVDQLLALEEALDFTNAEIANGDVLQAHLELWQGELLAGIYDEWVTGAREHYQARLLKLFLQLVHTLRARSEYALAIKVAQRILAHDPANEHAHQHLMFCYVASGDRPAALRQYEICERALLDDLDAPPLPETTALYEWIKQYEGDERSTAAKITNLPIPLSTFVGRTRETAEVKQLLTGARKNRIRLLTLMGAGGSGKTRLAIQSATDLIDYYTHGVWWIELAALSDGELVARTIAKALGMNESRGHSVTQSLANFIGDKTMLLVLDNCEHLIDACAQLAADLLTRCRNLQMLATSREAFNIAGELLWQVPTFSVPDPAKLGVTDLLLQYESVRLFVERAVAVQPMFTLTPENAKAVAEICQRLDGIPLAIELAAARVKVLSVEQIASYLTSVLGARFALLTQGSRAAMPRHQTLRATIDWSYQLLDEAERTLFRQVAVFRGGFTLALLEQVVTAGSVSSTHRFPMTLNLLSQLVDKSLLFVEPHGEEARYQMLETLREYALEQFADVGELARLQQQHAQAFLRLADKAEPHLKLEQQQIWLDHLEVEHANLRAALDYLIQHEHAEEAMQLATVLHQFWEVRGYLREGRTWLEATLANRTNATIETQAKALNAAGRLAFRMGDLEQMRVLHEEALELYTREEDEIGIAETLNQLAVNDMDRGKYDLAQRRLDEALAILRAAKHNFGIANSLSRLGTLAWDQDRFADSVARYAESLAIYRQLKMPMNVAYVALSVGNSERMLGDLDSAQKHYEECIEIARHLGNRGLVGAALKSLGLLAAKRQEPEQAWQYFTESLHIFRELGDRIHTAFALSHLGEEARKRSEYGPSLSYFTEYLQIMFEIGYTWPTFYALEDIADLLTHANQHTEMAARFLGAADALRRQTGLAVAPTFQARYDQMESTLRQQLGEERFDALRQAGEVAPLTQIVTEATRLTLS